MLVVTVLPVVGTVSASVRGMVLGGVWDRVGTGEGYTGYPAQLLEEGSQYSGAGPGSPVGAGVGGTGKPDVLGARSPQNPPCGPGRLRLPGSGPCSPESRLLANSGEN